MSDQKESCLNCRFWVRYKCHRFPPTVISETESYEQNLVGGDVASGVASNSKSVWPKTDMDDWCGEYQREVES